MRHGGEKVLLPSAGSLRTLRLLDSALAMVLNRSLQRAHGDLHRLLNMPHFISGCMVGGDFTAQAPYMYGRSSFYSIVSSTTWNGAVVSLSFPNTLGVFLYER